MQMSNRTAKFVSAIFASLIAGVPLTTVSHGAVPAADDCLLAPKGQTPSGGHWYYRIDRATKRHCWYLGDEKAKLSRVAPNNSAPLADPVLPQQETATQRSIADAHAELPLPQTRVEQQANASIWPPSPATATNAARLENGASAWDVNTQRSVVASRWPEQSRVSSSAGPEPTAGNSAATQQTNSEAASSQALAAVTLAAADLSSEKPSGPIRMLLIVIVGALSFAGLIGSAIFRFGSMRRAGRRQIRGDRRAIRDAADTGRPSRTAYPGRDVPMRRVDVPLKPREANDPNDRVAEMLARLSRSAAN
jgi:hypothetical protein